MAFFTLALPFRAIFFNKAIFGQYTLSTPKPYTFHFLELQIFVRQFTISWIAGTNLIENDIEEIAILVHQKAIKFPKKSA